MNERGKSYEPIVPKKPSNKGGGAPPTAEGVEGRGEIKGKADPRNSDRTQWREELQSKWNRIWQKAKKEKGEKFPLSFRTTAHQTCDKNLVR